MTHKIEIDGQRYLQLLEFERKHITESIYSIDVITTCRLCGHVKKEILTSKYEKDINIDIARCTHCHKILYYMDKDGLIKTLFDIVDKYEILLYRRNKNEI